MRNKPWLPALALTALAFAISGCELFPPPDPVAAVLNRCDLTSDDGAGLRADSLRLIEAAEAGTLPLASRRLIVGYLRSPPAGSFARAAAGDVAALRADHGLSQARSLGRGVESVATRADPLATARALLDDPRVRYAHPDVALVPLAERAEPNDPFYPLQWHLTGFGVAEAWAIETGSPEVVVAVIDSGVDPTHPDLVDRLEPGWDFYGGDDDPSSGDKHGTHVIGIVGAAGDDAYGVAGVARSGVRLVPVKVFDDAGSDPPNDDVSAQDAVVAALHWIAGEEVAGPERRPGAVQVANLSLGSAGSYERVPALDEAVRVARRAGVLVFAAAGNGGDGSGVIAPANGPCALAVGSIDQTYERSAFSNYDASVRRVDLVAPGGRSEDGRGVLSTLPGGVHGEQQGTSMSTPFVSGAAALLASRQPGWSAGELLEHILRNAYRPPNGDPLQLGFGVPCPDALLATVTRCGEPP